MEKKRHGEENCEWGCNSNSKEDDNEAEEEENDSQSGGLSDFGFLLIRSPDFF